MPTYAFKELNTGEVVEKFFSISARDQWLKDNPNWEYFPVIPQEVVDSVRMGRKKPDASFRDLLKTIKGRAEKGISRSTINTF